MAVNATQSEALEAFVTALRQVSIEWPRLLAVTKSVSASVEADGDFEPALCEELDRQILALVPLDATGETPEQAESRRALRQTTTFVAEAVAFGLALAITRQFGRLDELDNPATFLRTLAVFLDTGGLRRRLSPDDLRRNAAALMASAPAPKLLRACLAVLGLIRATPFDVRDEVCRQVALPLLKRAAERGDVDTLLTIESVLYEEHIKMRETQEHYRETFADIEAALSKLSPKPLTARRPPGSPPRVAFLLPNGIPLAHADLLLSLLRGLKASQDRIVDPVVYIYLSSDGGAVSAKLSQMGIEWHAAAAAKTLPYEERFDLVRQDLARLKIDAVVFVSLSVRLAYFCKRPLAPVQIWWPMKFILPLFEGLQGRISYGSIVDSKQVIDGRLWRGGPIATPPPKPPNPAVVAAIRERHPGKKILGAIAREEKIAEPGFLSAVVDILQRHPDAVFLWTGRERLPVIDQVFKRSGVYDRCHFIGWVDPTSHIAAFDVMLETYPLTGLVVGWAMALGKPVISVGDKGWLGVYLQPIFDGLLAISPDDRTRIDAIFEPLRSRLPAIWAKTPAEMADFADALLDSEDLRLLVGEVQKTYVETFMLDEVVSAEIFASHIADVIRETWSKRSTAG